MATTTVAHPSIGTIEASSAKEGVLQFLGLQYATLADRFAPAAMKEYSKDETINATKLGPQVLSIAPGPEGEFGFIQQSLEYDRSAFTMSETEGLCLNITVPKSNGGTIDANAKLPVFAMIHGGGFNVGSGMYPQYDMARFVQLSVKQGLPCVAVSLNYRLGAPGFLTSSAMQKAGYKPNNALRDQRTALLWLQRHIAGFGGNPENITLMGESAGGISVCYHLFSKEPLFRRMVSMSGTTLLMPPLTPGVAEKHYERAMKGLGLTEGDVTGLLNVEGLEMARKLMGVGVPYVPVVDGEIVPTGFDFESFTSGKTDVPGRQWCEAGIIGDCQFDGNIQALRIGTRKKGIRAAFCSSITDSLSSTPGIAKKWLTAYDLRPDLDDETAVFEILQVANDVNFYMPTLAFAEGMHTHNSQVKTYMYRFNEPNPWEGPWKGYATHILDISFLLQNYNEYLQERQRVTAQKFGIDVIRFVSGKQPWEEWESGHRQAKVMGPDGHVGVVEDVAEKVGRRSIVLKLADEIGKGGLDSLNGAFDKFMKAPPPV